MKAENIYTTAEALYTTAENIIKALNADETAQKLNAPREVWQIYNIWESLEKLRDEAAEEIRREASKHSGRATVYAAALRMLKAANEQPREALRGARPSADGFIDICDGFRLLRLDASTAPTLPENPANLPEYIDAARLYNETARGSSDPVQLPDPAELRAYIKTEKARKKAIKDKTPPLYTLTTDAGALIYFNADFLLDMLEALPRAKAYAADRRDRAQYSAITFCADNGRGLLLPVRPPKQ